MNYVPISRAPVEVPVAGPGEGLLSPPGGG